MTTVRAFCAAFNTPECVSPEWKPHTSSAFGQTQFAENGTVTKLSTAMAEKKKRSYRRPGSLGVVPAVTIKPPIALLSARGDCRYKLTIREHRKCDVPHCWSQSITLKILRKVTPRPLDGRSRGRFGNPRAPRSMHATEPILAV